ncbi:MAG: DUF3486 family protein [Pseudomonadota bacterium]
MPRKSTVNTLPPKITKQINAALERGHRTLDDLVAWLASEHGYTISRSALHRYSQNYETLRKKLAETREITQAFAAELGPDALAGKQGALLVEIMQAMVMKVAAGTELDVKQIGMLCRAVRDAASANRLSQDYEERLRKQITERAAKTAGAVAKKAGLTQESRKKIEREILGLQ